MDRSQVTGHRSRGVAPRLGVVFAMVSTSVVSAMVSAPSARATTYSIGDLDAYAAAADLIVEGRVSSSWTRHTDTALPMTYHEVDITHAWKGEVESRRIILHYPGGWSATGAWISVPGTPHLTEGAWVLAFARTDPVHPDRASMVHWTTGLLQSYEGDDPGAIVRDGHGRPLDRLPRARAVVSVACGEPAGAEADCRLPGGPVPWHELRSVVSDLIADSTGLPGARVAGAVR